MKKIRFGMRVAAMMLVLVLSLSCARAQAPMNILLVGVDRDGDAGRSDA